MGMRTTWSVLALILGLWVTSGQAETVTVAAEDDWAPYSSIKPDRSGPTGLSPDLVKAAFKTQGIDVRFVVLPFPRCLHYAQSGTVVACFNTTRTDANKDTFHWHPTPLFQEELAIFARADAPERELSQQDLHGRTVGVTIGYTYPTDFMGDSRITRLSAASDSNLLKMLVARRVDYILLNTMPGYHRLKHEPALVGKVKRVGRIRMDSFWLSFSKTHPDGRRLSEAFERGLKAIKANGQYDSMMATFRRDLQPERAP